MPPPVPRRHRTSSASESRRRGRRGRPPRPSRTHRRTPPAAWPRRHRRSPSCAASAPRSSSRRGRGRAARPSSSRPRAAGRGPSRPLVDARAGLDPHQVRHHDAPRLADHREVVAQEVEDHQVLAAEPRLGGQPRGQLGVATRVGVTRGGALDRTGLDGAVRRDRRLALGRGAQQPGPRAGHVVLQETGVRRGVERAQALVRRDVLRGRLLVGVGYQTRTSGDPRLRFLPTGRPRGRRPCRRVLDRPHVRAPGRIHTASGMPGTSPPRRRRARAAAAPRCRAAGRSRAG